MEIEIRLYHGLSKYLPPGEGEFSRKIHVAVGATVADVLAELGVPRRDGLILFIGGKSAEWNHILQPGDVLTAMLPAGGG